MSYSARGPRPVVSVQLTCTLNNRFNFHHVQVAYNVWALSADFEDKGIFIGHTSLLGLKNFGNDLIRPFEISREQDPVIVGNPTLPIKPREWFFNFSLKPETGNLNPHDSNPISPRIVIEPVNSSYPQAATRARLRWRSYETLNFPLFTYLAPAQCAMWAECINCILLDSMLDPTWQRDTGKLSFSSLPYP